MNPLRSYCYTDRSGATGTVSCMCYISDPESIIPQSFVVCFAGSVNTRRHAYNCPHQVCKGSRVSLITRGEWLHLLEELFRNFGCDTFWQSREQLHARQPAPEPVPRAQARAFSHIRTPHCGFRAEKSRHYRLPGDSFPEKPGFKETLPRAWWVRELRRNEKQESCVSRERVV